jgi:hypothetical protein
MTQPPTTPDFPFVETEVIDKGDGVFTHVFERVAMPFDETPEPLDAETIEALGLFDQDEDAIPDQQRAVEWREFAQAQADHDHPLGVVDIGHLRDRDALTVSDDCCIVGGDYLPEYIDHLPTVLRDEAWDTLNGVTQALRHLTAANEQTTSTVARFSQAVTFKLPDDVADVLQQVGNDITNGKWLAARTIVAYLEDMPLHKANAYRADVIKQAAKALQVDDVVVREWVHVAEVFPIGIEDDPRYVDWGFSLFARAARMSETDLAIDVLERARIEREQYAPGTPPPCWSINVLVKEAKARLKGATEAELQRIRDEAHLRANLRFSGRVTRLESLDRLVVIVPEDSDIEGGDDVVVFKKVSRD